MYSAYRKGLRMGSKINNCLLLRYDPNHTCSNHLYFSPQLGKYSKGHIRKDMPRFTAAIGELLHTRLAYTF